MVSICLDPKVEDRWEDLQLPSRKTRKRQFLQVLPTKASSLYVIGLRDQQMMQEAKMRLSSDTGIKKEAIVLLLLWTSFHPTKISS